MNLAEVLKPIYKYLLLQKYTYIKSFTICYPQWGILYIKKEMHLFIFRCTIFITLCPSPVAIPSQIWLIEREAVFIPTKERY